MNSEVWILIPVYNRRETTRTCLANLQSLGVIKKFTVCVIDDASSDGTGEMLAGEYPEVRVIKGDGTLYWGGGIARGMDAAREANAEVHVWLNDDCLPDEGSIEIVVNRVRETKGMCGGICRDPENETVITYSGARSGELAGVNPAPGTYENVDVMNGNLVAIHTSVVGQIGIVDSARYPHYGGDVEYCYRAHSRGIITEISGSARARNRRESPNASFGKTKPASAVFREPFRIASSLYWPAYWNILKLSAGPMAFLRWPSYFVRLFRIWLSAVRK
jgi:GT2 family glycosyltransferase